MKQYYIDRNKELTPLILGPMLCEFQTKVIPTLKRRKNYYDGKQDILHKPVSDDKPSNRIVANFIKNIVDNFEGYATGIPVKYQNIDEKIIRVLDYNDKVEEDSELFKQGLMFGRGIEICYIDSLGEARMKALDPRTCVPIYSDDLEEELLYVVRFWEVERVDNTTRYRVDVYDKERIISYKSTAGFTTFEYLGEIKHYFNQVPFVIFSLNREEVPIAENVFSLQDAYNSLISDSIDDADAFADAYLVLKGCDAEEEDLANMKRNKCLILDTDASADYLIKDSSKFGTDSLLTQVEKKIRTLSACPDFTDESFATSSGIAIRYKLLQMENITSEILNFFKKALQKRIELIAWIENLKEDTEWRDVQIIFTRNIPVDESDKASLVNQLRGIVSTETLLAQLPFIEDPEEEALKVTAETPTYNFEEVEE